ncbi:imelysin family protein [Dinoroseobacter sp. S124A]|uniref:imelysin family protein n=1 Tax=Dinoroseobacter sp. S124A TaxID=3415128 RepID=UPI003C797424
MTQALIAAALLGATFALTGPALHADTPSAPPEAPMASVMIEDILTGHILPRVESLAATGAALSETASTHCAPEDAELRAAFASAFDAWIAMSHLRFGPSEAEQRAFALAFWPDPRSTGPRVLAGLLAEADPIAETVTDYAQVSIAARGFYALELLLYDPTLMTAGDPAYHCQLVQTIAADIAATSAAMAADWRERYAQAFTQPGPDAIYRSETEVLQEGFKALSTGLQFTSETRLGRPMGTFERPRPARAEARRSGRSGHHVAVSLTALADLADRLSRNDPKLNADLAAHFDRSLARLAALEDPVFATVAEPAGRFRVEALQYSIEEIRALVSGSLGPTLGVAAGFNALDGD